MLIEGLENTEHDALQKMAFDIAQTWVSANYKGWQQLEEGSRTMFEKVSTQFYEF